MITWRKESIWRPARGRKEKGLRMEKRWDESLMCSRHLRCGNPALCLLDQADLVTPPVYSIILHEDICRFKAKIKHA